LTHFARQNVAAAPPSERYSKFAFRFHKFVALFASRRIEFHRRGVPSVFLSLSLSFCAKANIHANNLASFGYKNSIM